MATKTKTMSLEDACAYLNCSMKYVNKLISDGELTQTKDMNITLRSIKRYKENDDIRRNKALEEYLQLEDDLGINVD